MAIPSSALGREDVPYRTHLAKTYDACTSAYEPVEPLQNGAQRDHATLGIKLRSL